MTTSIKTCFKCSEEKSLTEFYRHKQMADGYIGKCKECNKIDVRANRLKNLEYYREYDQARGCRVNPDYTRMYRLAYPQKYKAHSAINNAVRDGRLSKPTSCEKCGDEKRIIGHHHDYLKPLDVEWLCQPCHVAWHHKNGEGLNGGMSVLVPPQLKEVS